MENKIYLNKKDLLLFNFNDIYKYEIYKGSGLNYSNTELRMYSNDTTYIVQETRDFLFNEFYKYIHMLQDFVCKTNNLSYYDFDKNKNKSYLFKRYKVEILPIITITIYQEGING